MAVDIVHVPYRGSAPAMQDCWRARSHDLRQHPRRLRPSGAGKVRALVSPGATPPVVPDAGHRRDAAGLTSTRGPPHRPGEAAARGDPAAVGLAKKALESDASRPSSSISRQPRSGSPADTLAYRDSEARLAPIIKASGASDQTDPPGARVCRETGSTFRNCVRLAHPWFDGGLTPRCACRPALSSYSNGYRAL